MILLNSLPPQLSPVVSVGPCPCPIPPHLCASQTQNLLLVSLNKVQILNQHTELGCGSLREHLPRNTSEGLSAWVSDGCFLSMHTVIPSVLEGKKA